MDESGKGLKYYCIEKQIEPFLWELRIVVSSMNESTVTIQIYLSLPICQPNCFCLVWKGPFLFSVLTVFWKGLFLFSVLTVFWKGLILFSVLTVFWKGLFLFSVLTVFRFCNEWNRANCLVILILATLYVSFKDCKSFKRWLVTNIKINVIVFHSTDIRFFVISYCSRAARSYSGNFFYTWQTSFKFATIRIITNIRKSCFDVQSK